MRIPLFLFYLVLTTTLSAVCYSQNDASSFYDFDPMLFNGRRYSFNLSYKTKGHPYLSSKDYRPGYVIIKGRIYDELLLNFDIYNQELVLQYINSNGAKDYIMVSKAWLDKFSILDKEFELIEAGEEEKEYFQVIGQDSLKVCYFWEKELVISKQPGNTGYDMSESSRTMYLFIDGEMHRFRNNRDFIDFFNPEQGILIKSHLKQNKINVRKADDALMLNLITHIKNLQN